MSNSDTRPDWPLLERFMAGECSRAEAQRVRDWLDANPAAGAALGMLHEAIDRQAPSDSAPATWDTEGAWSRLADSTREDAGRHYRPEPPLRRADAAPAHRAWLRAAVVLLAVGGGAGLMVWRSVGHDKKAMSVAAAPPRVVVAQRAERADLRLADGTHVILAPASRLTIPATFDGTQREVTLEGEAYFEVVHDSTKPFFVRTVHGLVHDLGTRFTVRAYGDDPVMQVAVAEGRVAVGTARSGVLPTSPVLGRGDVARLDTAGTTTVTSHADLDRYLSWIDGRLVLRAMPLREAVRELNRWYDVDFEIADSALADRRVTIALRDESLAQVVSAVALVTNARYQRDGRVVRFFALSPATPTPRAP